MRMRIHPTYFTSDGFWQQNPPARFRRRDCSLHQNSVHQRNQLFYCAHRFVVSLMSLLLFCFPVKECYCDGRLTKNSFFQLFFTKTSTFFLLRVSRQPQNASFARVLSFSPFQTLCLLLSINDRLLDEFIIASFFLEERKVYFFKNYVNWLQILLQNISSVNSLQKHYKNGKL